VIDSIYHEIQDHRRRDPVAPHKRQIGLSLTTQAYCKLAIVTTKSFDKNLIFHQYL
jgi:hypothetical protein